MDKPLMTPDGGEEADKPLMTPDGGEEAEKDPGAPEKYEPFKLPEGFALEGEEFEKVSSMLKGMNLSQSHAQELVDYFTQRMTDEKAAGLNALAARRKEWRASGLCERARTCAARDARGAYRQGREGAFRGLMDE